MNNTITRYILVTPEKCTDFALCFQSCIILVRTPPLGTMGGWREGPDVMVRPWKAGNYLRNRYLVRFRIIKMAFVFGIIIKKETGESPTSSDAITTLGIIKLFLYCVYEA